MRIRPLFPPLVLAFFSLILPAAADPPSGPEQPASGPGGRDYPFAEIVESRHGEGATSYWLFRPAAPAPAVTPVVVFMHGWSAIDPWIYGAWIGHLVKKGNTVIYPRYQDTPLTPTSRYTPNTITAIRDAVALLDQAGPDKGRAVDWSRLAVVGHSVGGLLTMNLAALAAEKSLPQPKALMCVQPGRSGTKKTEFGVPLEDLTRVPASSLLLCLTGERDDVCADHDARRILRETTAVPSTKKNHLIQLPDPTGLPRLAANHFGPCSPPVEPVLSKEDATRMEVGPPQLGTFLSALSGDLSPLRLYLRTQEGRVWQAEGMGGNGFAETFDPPNAEDFAMWRLFDELCAAAFGSGDPSAALGRAPGSLTMGKWSNGVPVKPMVSAGTD